MTWQRFVSGMGASTLLWNVFTGYLLYGEANVVDPGGRGGTPNNQETKKSKKQTEETNTQTHRHRNKKRNNLASKQENSKSCSFFRSMNYYVSLWVILVAWVPGGWCSLDSRMLLPIIFDWHKKQRSSSACFCDSKFRRYRIQVSMNFLF